MKFPNGLKRLNHITAFSAGVIILIIAVLTTIEGIARGIFNHPTTWSLDVCQYLLIWAIFLGSSQAFEKKNHVAVDFIREGMGRRLGHGVQRGFAIMGYLLTMIYVGILSWSSLDMLIYGFKWNQLTRGIIQIPVVWLYLAMLIGSVAMLITIGGIILDLIGGNKNYY